MDIRFTSTLTPEDEEQFAPPILQAASAILDQTGLAYTLRIETSSRKVFQHNHAAIAESSTAPATGRLPGGSGQRSIAARS